MAVHIRTYLQRLSLAHRFMLASFVILVAGAIGLGEWLGNEIEMGVLHRTSATTALYVDSFVAPHLQGLSETDALAPEQVGMLSSLFQDTPLGQQIFAFKVWGPGGRLLYSTNPSTIGQAFPVNDRLARAWQGEVTSSISDLQDEENVLERLQQNQLLEIYSPVRLQGTGQIIAVAEFYHVVDDLQQEIAAARQRSWLVVALAMLMIYLLLSGFVGRASDTIARQQAELSNQVVRLTELLAQNKELHERVRRAAARTTSLNERFLRRVSAELHDGPAQDLGLALLRLDHVIVRCTECYRATAQDSEDCDDDLEVIQDSLRRAMQEIRAVSGGLGLPQLGNLSLSETLARVVRIHERRTGTRVIMSLDNVPEQASLPVKITLYRLVQEALNNAYRHAGGLGQQVQVKGEAGHLWIEVSDQGPGFDRAQGTNGDEQLGLLGMRERVESLGGLFRIESAPGCGTKIVASLSYQTEDGDHE